MKRKTLVVIGVLCLSMLCSCANGSQSKKVSPTQISQTSEVSQETSSEQPKPINEELHTFADIKDCNIIEPKEFVCKYCSDFSINYPSSWKATEPEYIEADENYAETGGLSEGSTSHGIVFNLEGKKDEVIRAYGGPTKQYNIFKEYTEKDSKKDIFFVGDDLIAEMECFTENGRIIGFVLFYDKKDYDRMHSQTLDAISIEMSEECFNRNKWQIMGMIKSYKQL